MSEEYDEHEGPGGWDDPDELEDDEEDFGDEREEGAAQGEDPTSPARGFEDFDKLEEHDEGA